MRRTDITVHGFRSTFKMWCDEKTTFPNQAVEFCVAHIPGDEAEKAYRRRSDACGTQADHGSLGCLRNKAISKVINIDSPRGA
jgi:DNA gyrase inhibitor GyrI